MALSKQEFTNYIKQFHFREMFNYMGWDNDTTSLPIVVDNVTFDLKAVAKKQGFKILLCNSANGKIPDYNTRKKIETKVTKSFQEHLVIFTDSKKQEQIWQLVVRHKDKPNKVTETHYHLSQDPELIYQRAAGIFFELDEEEHITIIDVTKRVEENFHQNNERVTKQFYDKFKQQHSAFLKFIKGIDDKVNQEWYASLMLNRLMFCYFIQKKGFLDDNKNYLREKLKTCQDKKGKNKFYSFYRDFLLQLFHDGLGAPDHSKELKEEIGKIPYLNGGLFDTHEIEKDYKGKISIDDKAFEKIFEFFDQYEWHLDTRHTASGRDINPDVIGYIFEKYINDRAQMGAYYTKEDITDYISKNCILPFLFDETKRNFSKAFSPNAELWQMVKQSGYKYIYDAVKKGAEEKMPDEIAAGIKDVSKRTDWNKPAPNGVALPTEIWREVVDRRNRYAETKAKIDNGEIQNINDFITYNLNIRQFAVDAVANTNDPDFLRTFYKALSSVTIIDPTCGSGAFLFAAMNILEELYEQCIQRMQNFVSDAPKGKYKFFEETIAQVTAPEHPNLQYFIYKSIILKNLYGVDIMKEAVEIAKLRLFLKLVATVRADYRKSNLGLEPLPDIDFNIRSGNSLIGFATEEEYKSGLRWSLDFDNDDETLKEKMQQVAMAFREFKKIQLEHYGITNKEKNQGEWSYKAFKDAKDGLEKRIIELNFSLNKLLAKDYGIDVSKLNNFQNWKTNFQPFHWFAEFYENIHDNGGFNVIIGNPPYVEYGTKMKEVYTLKNFETLECGNLHAYIAERCFRIISNKGYIGLIVPLPSINTSRMEKLQTIIKPNSTNNKRSVWISAYDERPSSLFDGVDQRLIIEIISPKNGSAFLNTTGIKRWASSTRENLFPNIFYTTQSKETLSLTKSILKIKEDRIEKDILEKFYKNKPISYDKSEMRTKNAIYYRTAGGRYWKVVLDESFETGTLSEKVAFFRTLSSHQAVSLLSSSTFWWYYSSHFDMFNLKDYMIFGFRFSDAKSSILSQLDRLGKKYLKSLEDNSVVQVINSKTKGTIEQMQYFVNKSKPVIDEIDFALSEHYNFTPNEVEFITNYDIKNRLGRELENGEDKE